MSAVSHLRGHLVEFTNNEWVYSDTKEPTQTNRTCFKCGLDRTEDDHDGCIGTLDESVVMNACCGHGYEDDAYIQYWDGSCITGEDAINEQNRLKGTEE